MIKIRIHRILLLYIVLITCTNTSNAQHPDRDTPLKLCLTPLKLGGKWGYVDDAGKWALRPEYESRFHHENGYVALVKGKKYGIADCSGNIIVPFIYDVIYHWGNVNSARKGEKHALIDIKNNTLLTPFKYKNIYSIYGGRDYALVQKNRRWGIINNKGEIIVKYKYDYDIRNPIRHYFEEGYGAYSKNGKWGFLDNNFKEVLPFIYDGAVNFSGDRGLVKKKGEWVFIDKNGNVIGNIPIQVSNKYAPSFRKGLVYVIDVNEDSYILLNSSGEVLYKLDDIDGYDFDKKGNNRIRVSKDNKWGIIDTLGNIIVPFRYSSIKYLPNNQMLVSANRKYGLLDINSDYKEFIPTEYDWISQNTENSFSVKLNDKYGIIDAENNIIVPIENDFIDEYSNGFLAFSHGDTRGWMDAYGNIKFSSTLYSSIKGPFPNGLLAFSGNGGSGLGFMDTEGHEVIAPIYDSILLGEQFGVKCNIIMVRIGEYEFYIDKHGDISSDVIKLDLDNLFFEDGSGGYYRLD